MTNSLYMKNIYEPAVLQEINQRLDTLQPDTQRRWGTMDVAQMMAHCSAALEVCLGGGTMKSTLVGKLLGPFVRPLILSDKPYKPGLPTDKSFIVTGTHDFNQEKQKLKKLAHQFSTAGEQAMVNRKHPFFGKLTPMQ